MNYEIGQPVRLVSGEAGTIIGHARYAEAEDDFRVRYVAADGRLTEDWWNANAFESVTALEATPGEREAVEVTETNDEWVQGTPPMTTAPDVATPAPIETIETEVDVDGMPWNGDYHAKTKTKNADGRWKALRGKTPEAQTARDAFLSAGGAEPAPDVSDKPAPAPVATAPVAVPPMVPAAPMPAVAPVTDYPVDVVVTRLSEMYGSGAITADDLPSIYGDAGVQDMSDPTAELVASAEIRVALMNRLDQVTA